MMDDNLHERIEILEKENLIIKQKLFEFLTLFSDDMNLKGNAGLPIFKSQDFQKSINEFKFLLKDMI